MSQPAVSNCLNKIRQHFNDPLFLRVGNEMLPTELAKQIFSPISEIINKIEMVNNFKVDFDPTHSDQLFTLAMTDVSHLVLLPKLTKFLKTMRHRYVLKSAPLPVKPAIKWQMVKLISRLDFYRN